MASALPQHRFELVDTVYCPFEVRVRQGRLLWMSFALLICILVVVGVLARGLKVSERASVHGNDDELKALLDDFNAYSGNVAALVTNPVEMVLSMFLALVCLSSVAFHRSWTSSVSTADSERQRMRQAFRYRGIAVFIVGFMITSAFNALNIQVRPGNIRPIVATEDLGALFASEMATNGTHGMSNVTNLWSEFESDNPASNTVFRTLFVPFQYDPGSQCMNGQEEQTHPFTTFALPQRSWFGKLLRKNFSTHHEFVRTSLQDDNASSTANNTAQRLPMAVSRASELLLMAFLKVQQVMSPWHFTNPFPGSMAHFNGSRTALETFNLTNLERDNRSRPTEHTSSAFLDHVKTLVKRQLEDHLYAPENVSVANTTVQFWRVNVTSSIVFEAVRIEVYSRKSTVRRALTPRQGSHHGQPVKDGDVENIPPMDPRLLDATMDVVPLAPANLTAAQDEVETFYYELDTASDCGAFGSACLLDSPLFDNQGGALNPHSEVHVYPACVNHEGVEEMALHWRTMVLPDRVVGPLRQFECSVLSSSAMFVTAATTRVVGDVFAVKDMGTLGRLTNARKIYSFTFGRLAWATEDLQTKYHAAECRSESCDGLSLDVSDTEQPQHLVVGTSRLPMTPLHNLQNCISEMPSRRVNCMPVIHDPTAERGLLVLPHNFARLERPGPRQGPIGPTCSRAVESFMNRVVNNHIFFEDDGAVAFRTALLFLFQNAVLKDVITMNPRHASTTTTLRFAQSTQVMDVIASIPSQNVVITSIGCVVVLVLCLMTLATTWCRDQSLTPMHHMTPTTAVQILANEAHYPSWLLEKVVVTTNGQHHQPIAGYHVDRIIVRDGSGKNAWQVDFGV